MGQRIVVGISGASGAIYARRTLQLLLAADTEVHLVISPLGQRLLHDELGLDKFDAANWAGADTGRPPTGQLILHSYKDVGASIASGSFLHQGMVVIPCSSNSLSAIAHGSADNLLHRAAHVALKERRRLVLVHRETPLSLVDIRNMASATEAGAIICPANPGFYLRPQTLEDVVDFVVARVLDLLEITHNLHMRWTGRAGVPTLA